MRNYLRRRITPPRVVETAPKGPRPLTIESGALFKDKNVIVIRHGDRHYRLRITRFDKLILTS